MKDDPASSKHLSLHPEHLRRKRWKRRMDLILPLISVVGAVLASSYYTISALGGLSNVVAQPGALAAVQVLLPILVVLGVVVGSLAERPLWRWYLNPDLEHQAPPSQKIQQLVLNSPLNTALVTFSMWTLSGLAFVYLLWDAYGKPSSLAGILQIDLSLPIGLLAIAGPICSVLAYFIAENLIRDEIPNFFPGTLPADVPAFQLRLRWRLLLPLLVVLILMGVLGLGSYSLAANSAANQRPLDLSQLASLVLFVLGIGALVAVLLATTVGNSIAASVDKLLERMAAVRHGNLGVHLPVTSNEELGELAAGFNSMVGGLQQEEVVRHLFSLYVTPEVAEHAIQHGAELGGQLTSASVLFSDIRGFTALTETQSPEALIALLNRYFQAMSGVVKGHGGLVNKFGGDSLLAVFGTPMNPDAEHAWKAVQAAQAMQAALERFNADQAQRGEPQLRIGVGVASGPVVAGNVGSQERMEYTVIGDTVNLASRLQSMTKDLGVAVLLSGLTAQVVKERLPLEAIGRVDVRGKQEAVEVFKLC